MAQHEDPLFEKIGNQHGDTWHYSGDINLEHGGLFYMLDDHVEAVYVFPDPEIDSAEYEDEAWYIQSNFIFLNPDILESALSTCGYERADEGIRDCTGAVMTGVAARRLVIEAFHSHWGVEDPYPTRITRAELKEQGYDSLAAFIRDTQLRGLPVEGGPEDIDPDPSTPSP